LQLISLIPTEHWEYQIGDLLASFAKLFGKKRFGEMLLVPGIGECIPTRSGRVSLIVAIKALGLKPGARIGVPLYCCPVVFNAIKATGCIPRFIDVECDNFCLSYEDLLKKHSELDAIIAIHMFGNLCEVEDLQQIAKDRPVIEDCAQALGSMANGRLAGSWGRISFFSFRSGKYISAGEGGAIFSPDDRIMNRMKKLISEMPVPSEADEGWHSTKIYLKSAFRSKPLYGIVGYHLWRILSQKLSLSCNSEIAMGQMYDGDRRIVKKRIAYLKDAIAKQRAIAKIYSDYFRMEANMLCVERAGRIYNRYYYPVTFPSEKMRNDMASYLLDHCVDSIKYLNDIVSIAGRYYGYENDCPVSESLSKRVLIVPNYFSLREEEVEQICRTMNDGWKRIGK
jgi:perosamine synthetase